MGDAGEGGELEVAGETEAVEREGHDVSVAVAGNAVPRAADGGSGLRLVPGAEDAAGRVRGDALLELQEGPGVLVRGGGGRGEEEEE